MAHYPLNHHLRKSYRVLAAATGVYLLLAGGIGLALTWGDPFFHRGDDRALGLQTNPAGSVVLLVFGVLVAGAALAGGNTHHYAGLLLGWGLLGVAMVVLAFIRTDANVLNVAVTNVVVLCLAGLAVLTAGLYGKVGDPQESA